jgi:hypothetical protein
VASRLRGTRAGGTMLRPSFAYAKLPARDIERAGRFCADTMGVQPFAERDGHLYYDVGGCRLHGPRLREQLQPSRA